MTRETRREAKLLKDGITAALGRLQEIVPTMAYSDLVTVVRLTHTLGVLEGRDQMARDRKLFRSYDEDEEMRGRRHGQN